ncbi:hypothetical protein SESBI_21354 [Sesbania bispinosa]|nr:hypothetical protein SESBI_21354 [Sesbania bispinosa]
MKGNLQVQPTQEMEPKRRAETEMDSHRGRRLTAVRWAFLTARRRAAHCDRLCDRRSSQRRHELIESGDRGTSQFGTCSFRVSSQRRDPHSLYQFPNSTSTEADFTIQSSQLMNSTRTRHDINQFIAPQLSPPPTAKTFPMHTGTDAFARVILHELPQSRHRTLPK